LAGLQARVNDLLSKAVDDWLIFSSNQTPHEAVADWLIFNACVVK
jgi:hypothetical protein